MTSIRLPRRAGGWDTHVLHAPASFATPAGAPVSRRAYAAAHVVPDPRSEARPGGPAVLAWDATLAFRRHLWSLGLGVAEAMDTAQRGMGLDWPACTELIRRSSSEAAAVGGAIACGVGTDQLPAAPADLGAIRDAYEEQLAVVEEAGAVPILMASRHLAAAARGAEDYAAIYDHLLGQSSSPVILHWLGSMFDPALEGYWGATDPESAADVVVGLIQQHAPKVEGIKVSLLDADFERRLRRRLPAGVRLYTGDDFNYPELIRGDDQGHSDALLGVFAAIAPAAAAALAALDKGDLTAYDAIFEPTLPLARKLFAAPTYYYKSGIAFLAWLSGHQDGFMMVGGLHSGRSPMDLVETFALADTAGLFPDPDLTAARMGTFLAGVGLA